MRIRNKRAWLADRLCSLGIIRLLERFGRRPGLVILVYHRVCEAANDPFYRPLIVASDVFERQMRRLRDAFRLLRLEDLATLVDGSGRLDLAEPAALVTFDDGYRDNATLAAPILRSLGIPATIFVTTAFVGPPRALPWWDRVAYAVQACRLRALRIDRPEPATIELAGDRAQAVSALITPRIAAGWRADEADLLHLEERAGIDRTARDAAAARLFLHPEELAELAAGPHPTFQVGAHTHTHRFLNGLPPDDLADELSRPKAILEKWLGQLVNTVAYPYGGPGAFDQATQERARAAGYGFGFGLDPRPLRPGPVERWGLPRFGVGPADSANLLRARLALACHLGRSLV